MLECTRYGGWARWLRSFPTRGSLVLLSIALLSLVGLACGKGSSSSQSPESHDPRLGKVSALVRDQLMKSPQQIAEACQNVRAHFDIDKEAEIKLLSDDDERVFNAFVGAIASGYQDAKSLNDSCLNRDASARECVNALEKAKDDESLASPRRLLLEKLSESGVLDLRDNATDINVIKKRILSNSRIMGRGVMIAAIYSAGWLNEQVGNIASNVPWGQGALKLVLSAGAALMLSEIVMIFVRTTEKEMGIHRGYVVLAACEEYESGKSHPSLTIQLLRKIILRLSDAKVPSLLSEICNGIDEARSQGSAASISSCEEAARGWSLVSEGASSMSRGGANSGVIGPKEKMRFKKRERRHAAAPSLDPRSDFVQASANPLSAACLAPAKSPTMQTKTSSRCLFVDGVLQGGFLPECFDVRESGPSDGISDNGMNHLKDEFIEAIEESCDSDGGENCNLFVISLEMGRTAAEEALMAEGVSQILRDYLSNLDHIWVKDQLDGLFAELEQSRIIPEGELERDGRSLWWVPNANFTNKSNSLPRETEQALRKLGEKVGRERRVTIEVVGYVDDLPVRDSVPIELKIPDGLRNGGSRDHGKIRVYDNMGIATARALSVATILAESCRCQGRITLSTAGQRAGRHVEVILRVVGDQR